MSAFVLRDEQCISVQNNICLVFHTYLLGKWTLALKPRLKQWLVCSEQVIKFEFYAKQFSSKFYLVNQSRPKNINSILFIKCC